MGKVRAANINTINNEYRATPNRSNKFLSHVLASKGGRIIKYPRRSIIPQISLNKIFPGNPVLIHLTYINSDKFMLVSASIL